MVFSSVRYSGDAGVRGGAEWYPKDGMRPAAGTADVFIKPVMTNAVVFGSPVNDPLYSARRAVKERDNSTVYLPDHPVRAVSCTQQVSCNPAPGLTYIS